MCKVLGVDRNGEHRQFTIPIRQYRMAEMHLMANFVEIPETMAPRGSVVDRDGRVMNSDPESKL